MQSRSSGWWLNIAKVNPDLVVRDVSGKVNTVRDVAQRVPERTPQSAGIGDQRGAAAEALESAFAKQEATIYRHKKVVSRSLLQRACLVVGLAYLGLLPAPKAFVVTHLVDGHVLRILRRVESVAFSVTPPFSHRGVGG